MAERFLDDVFLFGSLQAGLVLVQMVDERELDGMEEEVKLIQDLSGRQDFLLAAVKVSDWNADLSPWPAPAVFGTQPFAGKAEETLNRLTETILPEILKKNGVPEANCLLGGYSLSALFALWASAKTDYFCGIAAASPSVWYPDFQEYLVQNTIHADAVYLSLGDKEAKTRNPLMATVKDAIIKTEEILKSKEIRTTLEWNPGNHFKDPALRTAKAFAWLIGQNDQ